MCCRESNNRRSVTAEMGAAPLTPNKLKGIIFMRNRTFGINIRVTEKEKKRIEKHAKKCRLSVSEYLRQLSNGYTPNEIPSDNFYLVSRDLEMMISDYRNKDDEMMAKMLRGCVDELYDIYIYPKKGGGKNGNDKNLADS